MCWEVKGRNIIMIKQLRIGDTYIFDDTKNRWKVVNLEPITVKALDGGNFGDGLYCFDPREHGGRYLGNTDCPHDNGIPCEDCGIPL